MKQADKAFILFVREKYPEYNNKTDKEILEAKSEHLNLQWFCFCSGWNAAVTESQKHILNK